MSWDASLGDREWNYTHNCNGMANAVLDPLYAQVSVFEEVFRHSTEHTWWRQLNGLTAANGTALLDQIIKGLEADPERFRAMNPPNGWGSYDRFLGVLREMRTASLEEAPGLIWRVSG